MAVLVVPIDKAAPKDVDSAPAADRYVTSEADAVSVVVRENGRGHAGLSG